MLIRLETNPKDKSHQLRRWTQAFQHLSNERLLSLATNKEQNVKNINVRLDALLVFIQRLQDSSKKTNRRYILTDVEVEQLYNLIKNEDDFPVLVNPNEIVVEEVTHEKDHEDIVYKKQVKKDIEENVALLKAYAALVIVDYGLHTKKFLELRQPLIKSITGILGNMLGEPDHVFVKEGRDKESVKPTNFFSNFIEALYFIDNQSAKPFMQLFNISESYCEQRTRKAS